jgi:hypothetical protein
MISQLLFASACDFIYAGVEEKKTIVEPNPLEPTDADVIKTLAEHFETSHEEIGEYLGFARNILERRKLDKSEVASLRSALLTASEGIYQFPTTYWGAETLLRLDETLSSTELNLQKPALIRNPRFYMIEEATSNGFYTWGEETTVEVILKSPEISIPMRSHVTRTENSNKLTSYRSLPENFLNFQASFFSENENLIFSRPVGKPILEIRIKTPQGTRTGMPWTFVSQVRYLRPAISDRIKAYEVALQTIDSSLAQGEFNLFDLERAEARLTRAFAELSK